MDDCGNCAASCGATDNKAISGWEIAFVADCNLRCTYCSTGFGRLGRAGRWMSRETWERLVPFILNHAHGLHAIQLQFFGPGETFLQFDEFLTFIRALRRAARSKGIRVDVSVSTNGVPLNRERLAELARRRINLRFSIDGPPEIHDVRRPDVGGAGSHARALANYRLYNEITQSMEHAPSCGVTSIVGSEARLSVIDRYWIDLGVPNYESYFERDSRYLGDNVKRVDRWRSRYLADMREIAMREAQRLSIPHFLADFKGPKQLFQLWLDIFRQKFDPERCGIGRSYLAVGVDGELFSCGGFFGFEGHSLGSLDRGLDHDALDGVSTRVDSLVLECETCEAAHLCKKGCAASEPESGLVLNSAGECDFIRSMVRIAEDSYRVLAEAPAAVT